MSELEREDLDKDWIRLRVLEAVLAKVAPSWAIDKPMHAVGKVLSVAIPLAKWVETGEEPRAEGT